MSNEDLQGEIDKKPSHDDNAAPSPVPEAEVKPEGQTDASATETQEQPKKTANPVQPRINQLTREKMDLRNENADLRARLEKSEQVKPIEKVVELVAPNPDDFDTDQAYHAANAKFYADVSTSAAKAEVSANNQSRDEANRQTQRQETMKTKKAAFEKNLDSKRGNFEDFEDVAYGHKFMDLDLVEQIFDIGEKAPEVAYHIGSNLDQAERIFALSPVQRARELTKLEFQVEALTPKKVSNAPDPITPLGNSEQVDTDGVNGENIKDADKWRAWRNNKVHGK